MTLLKIAQVGHPILKEMARPLSVGELASAEIQCFIDDLIETMRDANGAGLAATQVYRALQICVLEVGNNPRYPYKPKIPLTVLINPVLTPLDGEVFSNYEGCLSVPNLRARVTRHARIRVQAMDRHGAPLDFVAAGISAGTYQHECDHLAGRLFLDRVEDRTSFTTWDNFERFERERFIDEVGLVVAKYGS